MNLPISWGNTMRAYYSSNLLATNPGPDPFFFFVNLRSSENNDHVFCYLISLSLLWSFVIPEFRTPASPFHSHTLTIIKTWSESKWGNQKVLEKRLLEAERDFNRLLSSGFSVCVSISSRELWVRLQMRDSQEERRTNRLHYNLWFLVYWKVFLISPT